MFLNDGPVFGLPGTVTGDFMDRTQLLGDWGGTRTELARNGFSSICNSTSYYQDVTSGGLETGDGLSLKHAALDEHRYRSRWLVVWWPFHATAQSRFGADPESTSQ